MTKEKFEHEMLKAEALRRVDPNKAEYYAGYIRGLRRAYHGENFRTDEEHKLWLSLADDTDAMRRERGLGYRDGLSEGGAA